MGVEGSRKANGEVEYDGWLHERRLEDLKKMQKHDRVDEKPFEAVAALSELNERAYELLLRPAIREATSEWMAKLVREWHPLRASHWMFSDRNPMLAWLPFAAALAQTHRHPRGDANYGRRVEHLYAEYASAALDLYRDVRDAGSEAAFYEVYGNMLSLQMADQRADIRRQTRFDPRAVPAVRQILDEVDRGGLPEAVIRAGMLIAKAGSGVRRLAQMEHTRELLAPTGILKGLTEDELRRLLREETIVVEFEPAQAKRSLPRLARTPTERRKLHALFNSLESAEVVDDRQRALIAELRRSLPVARTPARPRPASRNGPPRRKSKRGVKRAAAAA